MKYFHKKIVDFPIHCDTFPFAENESGVVSSGK